MRTPSGLHGGAVSATSPCCLNRSVNQYDELSGLSAYTLRDPARGTQQLVLPLAPLAQLGGPDGVAAQVQKHLSALVEALAGKDAGSVRNAHAVGEELPARRLARIVSKQLDLQHVRIAGGAKLFLELLHRKAHLVGEAVLDQS